MLTLDWWNNLEDQWKKAFNEGFWNKGSILDAPTEEELKDISTTTVLRLVGPDAPYPNCSFNLTNLTGVEQLNQLEILIVAFHHIKEINPIVGLTKLKSLFLNSNYIEKLDGIENLKEIDQLYIQDNQIADISPIVGLDKVHTLYVTKNKIMRLDIPPNVKELYCLPNEQITRKEIDRVEHDLRVMCKDG